MTGAAIGLPLDRWLLDHVCPYWAARIVDPAGGYFEQLDANGEAVPGTVRSVLNQARLTYVFSHAYCLRPDPGFLRAALHGFQFLQRAQQSAPCGGWPRASAPDGVSLDPVRDGYDHAFVVLAMAWHWRATANPEALLLAEHAYGFMETRMADRLHGGFAEELDEAAPAAQKLPRRQNPHMHLLEAALAMFEATGQARWLARAAELVELFGRRFLDDRSGSVGEFFNPDWSPAEGDAGRWREPGHQFEWVWLLLQFDRHSGDPRVPAWADRLFAFGARYGIDRGDALGGLVVDGVDRDGTLLASAKSLWPQTEYIKACLARAELRGDVQAGALASAHASHLRRHFFRADGASWHNRLSRSGAPEPAPTPARVLYHLFMAVAELIRVLPQPESGTQAGTCKDGQ